MSITYEELKNRLTDLGFEEDDVVSEDEYPRIYINSFNLAGEILYHNVMLQIPDYILRTESEAEAENSIDSNGRYVLSPVSRRKTTVSKITKITEDTADDDEIEIPDIVLPLYVLLAAHYVWLDDDITKATYYWNEYDSLKNEMIATAKQPKGAVIVGGIGW